MSNLLLVEDEPAVRESLELYLKGQGHRLNTASSLKDALQLAEQVRPDAIVSDLMFEGGTGLNLRRELSQRHQGYDPGFILITGHASLDTALEAMRHGIDQYLLKPLNLKQLDQALEQALKKRRKASQGLKVRFELAEQFYHDLSLPLNLLIPRLCMLLEGRQGMLSMGQVQSLTGQFEYLRQILWVMKGFYPRLLEGQGGSHARNQLDANQLLRDSLSRVEQEFYQRQISPELSPAPEPGIHCARETAQAFLEILLTRVLVIAERNSRLVLQWRRHPDHLELHAELHGPGPTHSNALAPLLSMVPFSQGCFEQAGITFESEGPAGPWSVQFATL